MPKVKQINIKKIFEHATGHPMPKPKTTMPKTPTSEL
jgi:hypothetical protein